MRFSKLKSVDKQLGFCLKGGGLLKFARLSFLKSRRPFSKQSISISKTWRLDKNQYLCSTIDL
jgi:hypothetical protein